MKMKKLVLLIALIGIAFGAWAYTYPDHVLFGNYARTILTEDITVAETDFSVVTVTNFPTISNTNQYYYLVCLRGTDSAKEIVKVTAADTTNNVLTVVRAQEGTTAITLSTNDRIELWITASGLDDRYDELIGYTDAALSGAATVNTSNIVDYAVTAPKIATNAITNVKIADDAVDTDEIVDGAVTSSKILDNAVTTAKILDDNVTTAKILDSNVTKAKIEDLADYTVLGNVSGVSAAPLEVVIYDQDGMESNSATALVSQQSIKAYAETVAMQYSGATAYTGAMPTTFTNLSLSATIGANRCFVHLSVVSDVNSARVSFRTDGETAEVGTVSDADGQGTSQAKIDNTRIAYFSLITSTSGIVEWESSEAGSGGTVVKILCYQVLQ